jgi:hypothetical protein
MKKHISTFAVALAGLLLTGITASADPVASTTYGGHTYDLYDSCWISWSDAEAAAVADGGYLAVLSDAAETAAVYNGLIGHGFFLPQDGQCDEAWLGGFTADHSGSTHDPNNWAWVTGEAWTAFDAANFAPSEPNGDSSGLAFNRYCNSSFNDDNLVGGYVVERNSVPDGGMTLAFLGLSLSALVCFRRKLA